MNKFTKIMFATSAAIFMTISTNSYSDGIGGRAIAVEQARIEANRAEYMTEEAVKVEKNAIHDFSYTKGEGISGRAWVVDQAKYEANKVEGRQRISDSMENCSGLMEKDTLMRDNIIVTDRGVYERETSLQTISAVV